VNNPALQNVENVGPIPQGDYTIGTQGNYGSLGHGLPGSMPLTPARGNNMHGRYGFLMHGDNARGDRSASEGCIIMPRAVRDEVGQSDDKCLKVVP
jgi:hypothetical protein